MRIPMLVFFGLLLPAQSIACCGIAKTVERFVEAFNQRDVDQMLTLVATDLRWMNVTSDQLLVEASTQVELREAMVAYFNSTPGARAEIRSIASSGRFVHTVEEAFWEVNGTLTSQCSMAVYEIAKGKVQNVWYFPAHECS
ncbi:MAG: nuclear transport factor 2 family protein [Wenzhouxiangellaceae bacterium]|nr:nuclear transport factor 2 family protein [Wenzhouxiangellaceae bacterium]